MKKTAPKTKLKEIEFLESYLKKLQKFYQTTSELSREDFITPSDDTLPTTSPDAEHAARLADDYGFDGSIFRNLQNREFDLLFELRDLTKQIKTIPRIIAQIEEPADRSAIPDDAELLTVPQVARFLGWGESVVRQRDKEGILPIPIRTGGTIQWKRKEIIDWIEAGCPPRQKWELLKQGKET